jgi:hypothetical protein
MCAYMHIENLYNHPEFLTDIDSEVYALEKIHGTSAHIGWRKEFELGDGNSFSKGSDNLYFFSGGEKYENFIKLFDHDSLRSGMAAVAKKMCVDSLVVYGEAYGGRQQGMKATYGEELKFVAFDVKTPYNWLDVSSAHDVCKILGLEFVDYVKIPNTLAHLDAARDADSVQAIRNGTGSGKLREGIVIRPLVEREDRRGNRVILKLKRNEFRETKKTREVDPNKVEKLLAAQEIADEYVTENRLDHVLDHLAARQLYFNEAGMAMTSDVVREMLGDVKREAGDDVVWSKEAERAVGTRAAKLYKSKITTLAPRELVPA